MGEFKPYTLHQLLYEGMANSLKKKKSFSNEDIYDVALSSLTGNELFVLYIRDSLQQKSPVACFLYKAMSEYL